eukprot:6521434-Lingulodinium_polyedra.AAC.1
MGRQELAIRACPQPLVRAKAGEPSLEERDEAGVVDAHVLAAGRDETRLGLEDADVGSRLRGHEGAGEQD